ncbi:MAG: L,D-transpeptidase family protein [Myxococcales bacterium]|nr:L,D-transpeptidase family protein [Myxococcales bacterium]
MRPLTPVALLLLAALGPGCDRAPTVEHEAQAATPSSSPAPTEAEVAADDGATHAASAGPRSPAAAKTDTTALHLERPPSREPTPLGSYAATPSVTRDRVGHAFQFDAPVFAAPSAARRIAGIVRRNTRVAIDRWVPGEGCSKSWYALLGGGYVCTGDGFSVSSDPAPLSEALQVEPPAVERALPYRYAKVKTPAPLYWRLPTADELRSGSTAAVREQAQGAHFVAMDQTHQVGGTTLHRTVRGFYVRDEDLEAKPAPTMEGQLLRGAEDLPLAFVHVDEATLRDPESGAIRGTAERFARFAVAREEVVDGTPRVLARDGFAVAGDSVRLARTVARPEEVGPDDQWIHVDLDQQVLVAYEGDRPVLATLVSSGKEGFTPPLGLFYIHKKYTTVTMAGPDPDAGTYAVEQVPWTMYYWGSFALHGAYWHDEFGNVRSHGCTNIPPLDARWLFYWSEPGLPEGWHAKVGLRGPKVWFTRGAVEVEPDAGASVRAAAP